MSTSPATTAKPPFSEKLLRELKRLLVLAVLVGAILIAAKHYGFDRLNEEIRLQFQERLQKHYQGLVVSVRSARRVEGKGVEIRGISISEAAPQGESASSNLVTIDEIFAECDTRLPDFITSTPVITAVHVRRIKIRAERRANGFWSIQHLLPPPRDSGPAPAITITDGAIEIFDPQVSRTGSLTLRDIEVRLTPQLAASGSNISPTITPLMAIEGSFAGDHLRRAKVNGFFDPDLKYYQLQGGVDGLEFNPRLRAALPSEASALIEPLASVQGRSQFTFKLAQAAAKSPNQAPPPLTFSIDGGISEGRIDDSRLPDPLTDVEATIHADQTGLQLQSLTGRCGGTRLMMSARLEGYLANSPLELHVEAHELELERLPITTMPVAVRTIWDKFSPTGQVTLRSHLYFDGLQWNPELNIQCTNLSVKYDRLPYRVSEGRGRIDLKGNKLSSKLRFLGGGDAIECKMDLQNPGADFTGSVEIRSEGKMLINEPLLAALDSKAQRVVRAFHPQGAFSFYGRMWRNEGDLTEHRKLTLELQEIAIQHDKFAYPIDKVTGELQMTDDQWLFKGLHGKNDTADITGSGSWNPQAADGNVLNLKFTATDIPLEEELRRALVPGIQQLWTNLRPRGTFDRAQIVLKFNPASQKMGLEVDARKDPLSQSGALAIEPVWFRYKLEDLSGVFHYRDGEVQMQDLKGRHGLSDLSAAGVCRVQANGGWSVNLTRLSADRIVVDNELISALPAGLGNALVKLGLTDPVNMVGNLGVGLASQSAATPIFTWNMRFDMDNGRLNLGVPVEHIFGQLDLFGQSDGDNLSCRGEVDVETAMIRDVQFQQIRGPLWIDSQRLLAGSRAWVRGDQANPLPRKIEAYVFDGKLALDGELQFDEEGHFSIEPNMERADLAAIMREIAPHHTGLSGKLFGVVGLSGTLAGSHTWRGKGKMELIEADVYELPALVSILKLLSIQRPDRNAFTNCTMNFDIEGDELEFNNFQLKGDTISLKGKGRVTRQREVDFKFYTQLGREDRQLPILRPWLGEAGRQFMLIEVAGSFDSLRYDRTAFPHFNERLVQMFPELGREKPNQTDSLPVVPGPTASAESPPPRNVTPRKKY